MADNKRQEAVEATSVEYEAHLAESLRRIATQLESAINLQANARYIDVWKKLHGMRDSIVYNMSVLEGRVERMKDEGSSE
tara:strand:+ start:138 stop:377 length:240 start_codon:yes stop_codon:yes gene_type:complete